MNLINIALNFIRDILLVIQENLDFWGIFGNFIGGVCIIVFLFIWNEFLSPKRNLTGEWEVTNTVLDTDYKPFGKLKVIWRMHVLQNGSVIIGSGEKIKDIKPDNEVKEYEPTKRDTVEIHGSIERNYLRKSRVFINVSQVGQQRISRATYILKLVNDSTLVGKFITTAGNSKGTSVFSKNA